MQGIHVAFIVLLLAIIAYIGHQVWLSQIQASMATRVVRELKADEELVRHSKEFQKQEIRKVTDNIYMAIGYALANSIMIIAPEGLIIVDVTESNVAAKNILKGFRKITDKPIKALIYTHNHADHIGGAGGFVEDKTKLPEIWSHSWLPNEVNKFHSTAYGAKVRRSYRQFGVFVKNKQNAGIGIDLKYGRDTDSLGYIFPNKFVSEKETEVTIAGLKMKILHIPGETNDHIGLWIPEWKAVMCGDDIYKAYPNIYTIRGAPARDPVDWYTSVQRILDFEPEYLVPSHTQPVVGKENIKSVLEAYRDGIQFVHDQTLRYINKGYTPDDVVKHVKLPEKLALHPHLREYYGTIPWSVKGVFQLYLGWFSGDPVDLFPLSNTDKARRIVNLAGGVNNVLANAIRAWNENDIQWALELSSYILIVDKNSKEARKLKVDALTLLGLRQGNAIASNYYLTTAQEENGDLNLAITDQNRIEVIDSLGISEIFHILSTMFKCEECENNAETAVFVFKDSGKKISMQFRNAVAVVRDDKIPKEWDIKVTTTEAVLKDLMRNRFKTLDSIKDSDLHIDGEKQVLKSMLMCFDKNWN